LNILGIWLENGYSHPEDYSVWGFHPLNREVYRQKPLPKHIFAWKDIM